MSIFPTKVLLATDASAEAQLAATTAADLASSTNSELHVVHVGELRPTFLAQTEVEPAELKREAGSKRKRNSRKDVTSPTLHE
jgi:nucleotide-binding universal stress UspA family protein